MDKARDIGEEPGDKTGGETCQGIQDDPPHDAIHYVSALKSQARCAELDFITDRERSRLPCGKPLPIDKCPVAGAFIDDLETRAVRDRLDPGMTPGDGRVAGHRKRIVCVASHRERCACGNGKPFAFDRAECPDKVSGSGPLRGCGRDGRGGDTGATGRGFGKTGKGGQWRKRRGLWRRRFQMRNRPWTADSVLRHFDTELLQAVRDRHAAFLCVFKAIKSADSENGQPK